MAYTTMVVSIVSAAVAVASSLTAAGAQYTASQKAAEISTQQAKAAERQAAFVKKQGEYKERAFAEQTKRLLATQRARIGASGFEFTGSPLAAMARTKEEAQETLNIISEDWQNQAYQFEKQGDLLRKQAASQTRMGQIGLGLGGLYSAAGAASSLSGMYGSTPKTTTTAATVPTGQYGSGFFSAKPYNYPGAYPYGWGSRTWG